MGSGRLVGVDVARFLALAGMAAVHIFPAFDDDGSLHLSYQVASGRSSALFALLAGVSLVLASRSRVPLSGPALRAAQSGSLARAALLFVVGMLLGAVNSPPLVILAYYAVLFAIGTLALGLSGRMLAVLAVVAAVVTPVLSQFLRQYVEPSPIGEPGGSDLLLELFLTGTYPALTWTTYLFAGMAVARTDLRQSVVALRLVVVGGVLAVLAKLTSAQLLAAVGGAAALTPPSFGDVQSALAVGLFGTTPREDWDWLTVSAPHSGTTFDLAHTTGTALLVLGGSLILARVVPKLLLLPLAAAGSMTLTLYTAHVLSVADGSPLLAMSPRTLWVVELIVGVAAATLWRLRVGQGPLEAVSAAAGRAGRALVGDRGELVGA